MWRWVVKSCSLLLEMISQESGISLQEMVGQESCYLLLEKDGQESCSLLQEMVAQESVAVYCRRWVALRVLPFIREDVLPGE